MWPHGPKLFCASVFAVRVISTCENVRTRLAHACTENVLAEDLVAQVGLLIDFVCHHRFSGAEIRSVCTEAGMFAIRARRKVGSDVR